MRSPSLFALSLSLSFCALFGAAGLVGYRVYSRATLDAVRSCETTATLSAKLVLEHQRAAIGVLRSYGSRARVIESVRRKDTEGALGQLVDLAKNNPEMEWPYLTDPGGTLWINHPVDKESLGRNLSGRDWYKGVSREWKPYISSVYRMIVGERDLAVTVAVPVFDAKGKPIGILCTAQSAAFFRKIVEEIASQSETAVTLVDREGHLICSTRIRYTKEVTPYPSFDHLKRTLKGLKGNAEIRDVSGGNRLTFVSFARVGEIGWSVIVERSRNDILRSACPSLALIAAIASLIYAMIVSSLFHLRERQKRIDRLEKLNQGLESRVRERTRRGSKPRTGAWARKSPRRKLAEQALRESERRYRFLFENMLNGYAYCRMVYDEEGRPADFEYLDANNAFEKSTGLRDVSGRRVSEVIPGIREAHPELFEIYGRTAATGIPERFEVYLEELGTWLSTSVYSDRKGYFVAIVENITGRKLGEEAARKRETDALRLARIGRIISASLDIEEVFGAFSEEARQILPFDRLAIGLISLEKDRVFLSFVAGIDIPIRRKGGSLALHGSATEAILQGRKAMLIPMDDRADLERRFPALLPYFDGGVRNSIAVPLFSRNEVIGVLHFQSTRADTYSEEHLRLAEIVGGQIAGAVAGARLFAEHRRMDQARRESQTRYRELFDDAPVGYHELDAEGRIVQINRTEREMLGYSSEAEMVGRFGWEFIAESEESRQAYLEKISGERPTGSEFERTLLRKGATSFPVVIRDRPLRDSRGRIVGMRCTVQDITERKKAEKEMAALQEEFRQAQRMEAVGRLAGGVAHDFNNLLTIIRGYCQLALEDLEAENPLRPGIEEIFKAGTRAANLTRQLLAFSRRQVLELKNVDLNALVGDLQKMLRRLIGEDIELLFRPGQGLGRVRTDPGQIEQVVVNLAVNARDAMPEGGRLVIETDNVEVDEVHARGHLAVSPGPHVRLSVSDTGCGMTPEVRERAFEPFFTTKEKGKGTGLGLSTVYGIVKQCGGDVWVYSEPGHGAAFRIYLPRVEGAGEAEARALEKAAPARGTETVLVVEDDEPLRRLTVSMLRRLGYQALDAPRGGDALLLFEHLSGSIHLVLTDVIMPGLNGAQLVDRLRKIRQDVPVLYMSGYTDDAIGHHGVLEEGIPFLQKPFTAEMLAEKVRAVLDRGLASGGRE